jgi:prepilin-type N-terminal cleavage/methylation domain-containing protein
MIKGFAATPARGFSSSGMTLLEVLIAVLLFAIFSGTFLMVTEMIGQLLPMEQAPARENSCNGPALEEACVNVAFDMMLPYLEESNPLNINISENSLSPNQLSIPGVSDLQLAWPDAYKLEIIQWGELSQTPQTDVQASRPGLYLLQATPTTPAFWRKPIQRLFCRPYHRCIKP